MLCNRHSPSLVAGAAVRLPIKFGMLTIVTIWQIKIEVEILID